MNGHLSSEAIQTLVEGRASEVQLDVWLEHIQGCDHCLASVDQAWPSYLDSGDLAAPALEDVRLADLRSRIFQRIHLLEVGRQGVRLAVFAPIAFLQGLFGSKRR